MSEQVLKVGDQLSLARAGAEDLESSYGTVKDVSETGLTLEADSRLVFIRPGVLLILKAEDMDASVGWAAVDDVRVKEDGVVLKLTKPRWEDATKSRAPRVDLACRVIVSFVDPGIRETKRTVGQSINVSLTGVRIRVRSPLPQSALLHLQLFLNEDPCVAIGQVARIVEGSEAASGGFEVGINFVRFLQGYEELTDKVNDMESENSSAMGGDEFGFPPPSEESQEDPPAAEAAEEPPAESEPTEQPQPEESTDGEEPEKAADPAA